MIGVFTLDAPRGTPDYAYLDVWLFVVCAGWTITAEDGRAGWEAALGLILSLGAVPAAILILALIRAALILVAYPLGRRWTLISGRALQRRGFRA